MFRPRVIPCLLLKNRGLVKTVRFADPFYLGDPINTVRIFNEKEVDEIVILDITATAQGRGPDFERIKDIVDEAFMPVCYGGGVTGLDQMEQLFSIGIEKVSLSTAAVLDRSLITEAAKRFGNQAIVATLDVKKTMFKKTKIVHIINGRRSTGLSAVELAKELEGSGAGELLINDIDRDGTMSGYDIDLLRSVTRSVNIPVIGLGGAGTMDDLRKAIVEGGCSAAGAGSLFVYYGRKKGVLINYPNREVLDGLLKGGSDA